ncbi:uncharacterized protein PFLUO_LOCUS4583 [Penicillium psychrofluorescens]|uniref:uncharacterized protein n=1 Tax=Penicillium psychrofluorescens TaxID=3158075 RepID=UPI003CCCA15C
MEETYEIMATGNVPDMANLMLFLVIFAGGSLAWSSQLLERLNTTQAEASAAFTAYSRLALSIVEDDAHPVAASTIALASISILSHLVTNSDGFGLKVHMLRMRCLLMMRELKINSLDTPASSEERRLKGCNMIEIEVQRRIWWSMVASDWLIGFSGGHHEGAYIYQPRHMQVNYPANTDDEFITPTATDIDLPSSVPTAMSGFLFRVRTAKLCREIVDAMPSVLLDDNKADYHVVLAMDAKFQTLFKELPWFLQLDPENVEKSKEIVTQRPWIAFGRISGHFSLHSRLCRLHRPYHLEGMTNPKYAYSHEVCIRSAQTVLELRRQMDEAGAKIDIRPSRFWTVMQHVFVAALVLATDVSFSPDAPDAEARKAKVLMAYQILESSKQESSTLVESIQRNLQILMSALQKQRVQPPRESTASSAVSSGAIHDAFRDEALGSGLMEVDWDQLWTEFLAVAPDLDAQQWNSLLDDVDLGGFHPALF